MHLTLSRNHSSPAKPTTTKTSTPPPTPAPAPASPPKGVKRIVSGLRRRISHTFLRGHRHHATIDALDASHPALDGDAPHPSPLLISAEDAHPIPISVAVSPHPHPSVDTLIRAVSEGGLGKHVADCSDSSDATSSYSSESSFRGRGHRAKSSDSGSFSYTSPGGLHAVTGDEPPAAPLPEIAESLSGVDQADAPQPPGSLALDYFPALDDLALSIPLPEDTASELDVERGDAAELASLSPSAVDLLEDKRSTQSLYSRLPSAEPLTAPLDTDVFEEGAPESPRARTLSLASFESLTAPLESLILTEAPPPSATPSHSHSDAVSTHLPLPAPAPVDASLLSPESYFTEEPRQRKISMLSIESLTAPLESLVLPDDETSPPPLPEADDETSPADIFLSIPLPPSTADSPQILPVEAVAVPELEALPKALESQSAAPAEPPRAQTPVSPSADLAQLDVPVSPAETPEASSQEEVQSTEPEEEPPSPESFALSTRVAEDVSLPPEAAPEETTSSSESEPELPLFLVAVAECFTPAAEGPCVPAIEEPLRAVVEECFAPAEEPVYVVVEECFPLAPEEPVSAAAEECFPPVVEEPVSPVVEECFPPATEPLPPSAPSSPSLHPSTPPTPPTPPLAASDAGSESEDDEDELPEDFEFHPLGLTLVMPTMFLPAPKVRYPAFSSLTWWLPSRA